MAVDFPIYPKTISVAVDNPVANLHCRRVTQSHADSLTITSRSSIRLIPSKQRRDWYQLFGRSNPRSPPQIRQGIYRIVEWFGLESQAKSLPVVELF
ncbi:hypothetical protein WISP_72892 [Willisornis vidua]|uniref:Uncharacterized protein n=1 Tax=Willisornis vidua TaxID=1566151 RepID=A0ABQ9D707_9PASS|nr:hypothetical protein WISP_72892 [Willisornis vidua]